MYLLRATGRRICPGLGVLEYTACAQELTFNQIIEAQCGSFTFHLTNTYIAE